MDHNINELLAGLDTGVLQLRRKRGRPQALTRAQQDIVRILLSRGYSPQSIAKLFGVSRQTIARFDANKEGVNAA